MSPLEAGNQPTADPLGNLEILDNLIRHALVRFQARCFGNAVFNLDHLDHEMAIRIARRLCEDFASCMRDLVDIDYPHADKIRVVMDNLSTHTASAIYQTFPAHEARRILRRLEFHYTPRHASWLNMAEIEIGVMRRQCLDRRIDNRDMLETEVRAWERRRTKSGAKIRWMFSTDQARVKMAKSYPSPSLNES